MDSAPGDVDCSKENVLILAPLGQWVALQSACSKISQANVYGICGERNIDYVESIGAIKAYSYESDFVSALKHKVRFDFRLRGWRFILLFMLFIAWR